MADDLDKYKIKQLSIFSENRPGRLMDFSKAMGEENINILAFSIAEGAGYGVIRAFVSDPEKALRSCRSTVSWYVTPTSSRSTWRTSLAACSN